MPGVCIVIDPSTPAEQSLGRFLRSLGVPARRDGPVSAAGKDRAAPEGSRWRRSSARAVVPAPRRPGVEMVDAVTRVAHRVSPEELLTGRHRGNYQALCSVRLLAASLTDPGYHHCRVCAS